MTQPLTFLHALNWADIAAPTQAQTKLSLLDLIGVAAGGTSTRLGQMIAEHASEEWAGIMPLIFSPHQLLATSAT